MVLVRLDVLPGTGIRLAFDEVCPLKLFPFAIVDCALTEDRKVAHIFHL